jgi:hypothetical protein
VGLTKLGGETSSDEAFSRVLLLKDLFSVFKHVMVPFKNLPWKSSMRIVKCSFSGPIATIVSCVPLSVGKSNICEPI